MKTQLLLLFLLANVTLQAQYTYISDRRFFAPDELVGYDFKPSLKEIPNEEKEEIDPGEYSFGITFNNLYVEGQDIKGVYNINNIHPEEYGYKLLLMNARDARLQGHLKVVVNKYGMVETLIFKRSPNEKEIIFYMPAIPGKLNESEKSFFTDRGELAIAFNDSLWGKTVRPFLRIHKDAHVQERLRMGDSTSIRFIEKVTVEEKKKKNKTREVSADSVLVADSTSAIDSSHLKIIRENFVEVRSILRFEDGTREDKTWSFPVKRIVEKEDKKAGLQEERFQLEFVTDDKEKIYLYLNGDRTVSSFEVGDKQYLMRGF